MIFSNFLKWWPGSAISIRLDAEDDPSAEVALGAAEIRLEVAGRRRSVPGLGPGEDWQDSDVFAEAAGDGEFGAGPRQVAGERQRMGFHRLFSTAFGHSAGGHLAEKRAGAAKSSE
jgi:hypothetical protein